MLRVPLFFSQNVDGPWQIWCISLRPAHPITSFHHVDFHYHAQSVKNVTRVQRSKARALRTPPEWYLDLRIACHFLV